MESKKITIILLADLISDKNNDIFRIIALDKEYSIKLHLLYLYTNLSQMPSDMVVIHELLHRFGPDPTVAHFRYTHSAPEADTESEYLLYQYLNLRSLKVEVYDSVLSCQMELPVLRKLLGQRIQSGALPSGK